jgi:hypothetical protein
MRSDGMMTRYRSWIVVIDVIITSVICDGCLTTRASMPDEMVPESWIRWDGKHYCTRACFAMVSEGFE